MKICKALILFICIFVGCGTIYSATDSLSEFIRTRGGNEQQASLATVGGNYKGCFSSHEYLLCLDNRTYPGIGRNVKARYAILQGLNVTIKNMVYNYAIYKNKAENFRDQEVVKKAIVKLHPSLAGIEFLSRSSGDWAGAVAAIKRENAREEIEAIYAQPIFKDNYAQISLPVAKSYMDSRAYQDALFILKELHDLKFANAEAYILAGKAFMETGDKAEAKKLAKEVWETLHSQLNAEYAEQLGDLFQMLGEDKEAIDAYELASKRLMKLE